MFVPQRNIDHKIVNLWVIYTDKFFSYFYQIFFICYSKELILNLLIWCSNYSGIFDYFNLYRCQE